MSGTLEIMYVCPAARVADVDACRFCVFSFIELLEVG